MSDKQKKEVNEFQCLASHRGTYVKLLKAEPFMKNGKPQGEPKYSASFMFETSDEDLKRLQTEVTAMLRAKHEGKKFIINRPLTQEELDAGNCVIVQVPWRNGDKEADRMKKEGKDGEVFRGHTLVKASSKYRPDLSAIMERGKLPVDFLTEEAIAANAKFFYSGAWYVPLFGLHYYAGDERNPPGVSLYLNAVMFHKNDTKLGGARKSAAETFKHFIGTISDEDPTAGQADALLDDEILS